MLSAIVITLNEETMIEDCLISLKFADEIIVVDTGNTDKTNIISKGFKAKIVKSQPGSGYNNFRNDGLKSAKGDWILYVDADERVTPLLAQEIEQIICTDSLFSAYRLPRRNFYLGKEMKFGGWGNDKVVRLYKKEKLRGYEHALHEQPMVEGEIGDLENSLVHFSHRDLESMLEKTLLFTGYESDLRLKSNHPAVVSWRLCRVMLTEFWHRFIKLQAWRDGVEGIIDGIFQVFNMFVIYARLWEAQIAKR
ncbi:glycosyltransferase family 2 protein [Candidatus Amesbacteria bacterium]|nr:glycosyltransferase family 2 protein [Candidatus Amesbacteria bacterium]